MVQSSRTTQGVNEVLPLAVWLSPVDQNYYCFDVPAATKDLLMGYMGMDKAHFEVGTRLRHGQGPCVSLIMPCWL